MGAQSPVRTQTPVYYLDFEQQPGARVVQEVPQSWNAFLYVLSGMIKIQSEDEEEDVESEAHHTLVLSDGDSVQVTNMGPDKAHFVLIAGQPIGEPVAQYGPFVMNTQEEINEAITDYNLQQNGFENAHEWRSAAQK